MSEQQEIGHLANWNELRTESGEFWHPEFWHPALNPPKDEAEHLRWYVDRITDLNLETTAEWLEDVDGKGIVLATLDLSGVTAPEDGWFILAVNDSEDGPFITWARIRKEETPA